MERLLFVTEQKLPDGFCENAERTGIDVVSVSVHDEIKFENAAVVYFGDDKDTLRSVFDKAVENGVKRIVYVASVACFFARRNPEDNLENHLFVKRQVECEKTAISFSDKTSVSIAEVPGIYKLPDDVFVEDGVPAIKMRKFYLTFDGGFPVMSVESASDGVLSVVANGENGVVYPLCDKNVKFKTMLSEKYPDAKVYEYPEELWFILAAKAKNDLKKSGKTQGVDLKKLYKTDLYKNYFFDDAEVRRALKYEE